MSIDWDAWRADHANMDFRDQQAFYKLVAELHPSQQHFDLKEAEAAFDLIGNGPVSVVELGGWDGALAARLIPRFPIVSWTNYDLVMVPPVCMHPAYTAVVLADYFWNLGVRKADVFVATHTIEHLTGEQLAKLLDSLDVKFMYLEAPLGEEGQTWVGYRGSHILELGWREVRGFLAERDYEEIHTSRETGLWLKR